MHVAIVGAGIGGLTLAIALRQAGHTVAVYEKRPELGEFGGGIHVTPNAVRLLQRLGLGNALSRDGVRPVAIEGRRWQDDTVLGYTDLGDAIERRFGAPYYTIHRGDLHGALARSVPSAAIRVGTECTAIVATPGGIGLAFADGTSAEADLVVGADGIRSVVRATVCGDAPRYSGQAIYRGLAPANRLPFLLDQPKVISWLGPGQHCVCYPIARRDLINVVATVPVEEWTAPAGFVAGDLGELMSAYAGWNSTVTSILAALDAVTLWALFDHDPVDRWSGPRTTLLGDAAHAMLPFVAQGANQAIEDAVVLTACLTRYPDDLDTALERYEHLRRLRTLQLQSDARGNAIRFHLPDGDAQRERDAHMRRDPVWRDLDWLFGYDPGVAIEEATARG